LATLLPQISAVSLPIVAILSPQEAGALVAAGVVALLTTSVAHAVFPSPVAATAAAPASATVPDQPEVAARSALLDTLVLLPVPTWFILDASQVAVVVLIVIVTLLQQADR
jgi:hypothetical protein